MGSTRKRRPQRDPIGALIEAVAADLAQRLLSFEGKAHIAVAYSGGRDSSVLLDLLARLRDRAAFRLSAFHVHHGLSPNADAWIDATARRAEALQVAYDLRRVDVRRATRTSLEACAREARMTALRTMCEEHGAQILALAHHADDQAETVLLQSMRGAGVAGLASMAPWARRDGLCWWRPLLAHAGGEIGAYAEACSLAFVDDESNRDLQIARNAVRHVVMPALTQISPGVVAALGRTAGHMQDALALLQMLGEEDLNAVACDGGLSIAALGELPNVRRVNALRAWIAGMNIDVPSAARIAEVWRQAASGRDNAQPEVRHATGRFLRYRGVLSYVPDASTTPSAPSSLHWTGQPSWRAPGWPGEFRFTRGVPGIAPDVLGGQPLHAMPRIGGERLRTSLNQPARDLKHWYQRFAIPVWRRQSAPLLRLGDALLYAPYVGMAIEYVRHDANAISVEWHPDQPGAAQHV